MNKPKGLKRNTASFTILGIDPGSRNLGFSVIRHHEKKTSVELIDVLKLASIEDHHERLRLIFQKIKHLIKRFEFTHCAIETPVYGKDPLAMLKLGRAQAACILAIKEADLPLTEYYPKAIKKAVTGNGNASKQQVAFMLDQTVGLPEREKKLSGDETDALAVALCHLQTLNRSGGATPVPKKKYHQNNAAGDWSSFVKQNPDRVK
jgi:crossover junction endodeoxyribonuclease RuvC